MAGPPPSLRILLSGDFQGRAFGDLKNRLWTTTIDRPTYHWPRRRGKGANTCETIRLVLWPMVATKNFPYTFTSFESLETCSSTRKAPLFPISTSPPTPTTTWTCHFIMISLWRNWSATSRSQDRWMTLFSFFLVITAISEERTNSCPPSRSLDRKMEHQFWMNLQFAGENRRQHAGVHAPSSDKFCQRLSGQVCCTSGKCQGADVIKYWN